MDSKECRDSTAAANSQTAELRVILRRPATPGSFTDLAVLQEDQVIDIKTKGAYDHEDTSSLQLIYAGSVWNNEKKLSEIGVADGATIWLISYELGFNVHEEASFDEVPSCWLQSAFVPTGSSQSRFSGAPLLEFVKAVKPAPPNLPGSTKMHAKDAHRAMWNPAPSDFEALKFAVSTLKTFKVPFDGTPKVTWFGEYGCVLLADMRPRDATVSLRLVCLDGWFFKEQASSIGRTHASLPALNDPTQLFVGKIEIKDANHSPYTVHEGFLQRLHTLIAGAQQRQGEKRSAAGNVQGHQNTPAFIEAVVQDALSKEKCIITKPGGGFTDVGMHTGGSPRNTSWPLARAVIQVLLEQQGRHHFYRMAMAQLFLWEAERCCHNNNLRKARVMGSKKISIAMVDLVHKLLEAAVHEGAILADELPENDERSTEMSELELCLHAFEVRCALVQWDLRHCERLRAERSARNFELTLTDDAEPDHRAVSLALPPRHPRRLVKGSFEESRENALKNSGWLPSPLCGAVEWSDVAAWMTHPKLSAAGVAVEVLHSSIERVFFAWSSRLSAKYPTLCCPRLDALNLEKVLYFYRSSVSSPQSSSEPLSQLNVERRSKELLVTWIAFCLVYQAAAGEHSAHFKPFVPALDPADLSHLVLQDKAAIDAALEVAAYLHSKRSVGRPPIFSLRARDGTFDFARSYTQQRLLSDWQAEEALTNKRHEDHWTQVKTQKQALRNLDAELARLNHQLKGAVSDMNDEKRLSAYLTHGYFVAKQRFTELENLISETKRDIVSMETPPRRVLQPLPRSTYEAFPVLFFIRMPPLLRVLSRLSFSAQQMLLPRASQANEHIAVPCFKEDLCQYYATKSTARKFSPAPLDLNMGSPGEMPKFHQPETVRDFSYNDGVFYPDGLQPCLYWNGGGFGPDVRGMHFDPFRSMPPEEIVAEFTEPLLKEDQSFSWAVEQHGSGAKPSRGSVAEAALDTMPSWLLTKESFLRFGALRAYPLQQTRKLCIALAERSLPLQEPTVRTLIQSSLYQLGELDLVTEGKPERRLWRTDLSVHGGWEVLRKELSGLAGELQNKPREYGALHILGEIAAHASQWDEPCRDVARTFASTLHRWAMSEHEEGAPMEDRPTKRARRALFYMYGIICHGAGKLSEADVSELCKFIFLADYCQLFEEMTPLDEDLRRLRAISLAVVARRLPEILAEVDRNPTHLTEAVRRIFETQTPDHLEWRRLSVCYAGQTCCYEAVALVGVESASKLFTVNLFTGVVLLDGLPPSRLPARILEMPLYKRTFSKHNFEVTIDGFGVLTTIRPICGYTYTFYVTSHGALEIHEKNCANSGSGTGQEDIVLELLNGCPPTDCQSNGGVESWGANLPIRLKHMYSHWYSRSRGIVVLRPRSFKHREIEFVMWQNSSNGSGESCEVICQRVPKHLQREMEVAIFRQSQGSPMPKSLHPAAAPFHWPAAQEEDRLVLLAPSAIIKVLNKFETKVECIHCFITRRQTFQFELPRFGLNFELQGGRIKSRNFFGCALAEQQQLPDTLYGFTQYLVLESDEVNAPNVVIFPAGVVVQDADTKEVVIEGSDLVDADRSFHAYEKHPRFGSLEVRCGPTAIEARLQLAALYAATGSALPEEGSSLTGGEMALELLRQCWKADPHTATEHEHLQTLDGFSRHIPGLTLLAKELESSALNLAFLHCSTSSKNVGVLNSAPVSAAAAEYVQDKQALRSCSRAHLTDDEEDYVLSFIVSTRPRGGRIMSAVGTVHVPPLDEGQGTDVLEAFHKSIAGMVEELQVVSTSHSSKNFPLDTSHLETTTLGKQLLTGLRQSWEAHQSTSTFQLRHSPESMRQPLKEMLAVVVQARETMEAKLLSHIDCVPTENHWHAPAFNMRRAVNLEPRVTLRDLARAASEPAAVLFSLNPFLTCEAITTLHNGILLWLEHCVVEDKLHRMIALAAADNEAELAREALQSRRAWSAHEHPHWLVFEVEQRLQIRHEQYEMARFLLVNEMTTSQLNMGEGKTRVILPMLVLELARPGNQRLVRLNFLSQLLSEAYHVLHHSLTASLAQRRLVYLPFHRGVELTPLRVHSMIAFLERTRAVGGVVVVAPEHRLSLQLKCHVARLANHDALVAALTQLDAQLGFFDILDESDEVLSHRYQLIYAVGAAVKLPAGEVRWLVAQALVKAMSCRHGRVSALLQNETICRRLSHGTSRGAGTFDDLRLLPCDELESATMHLLRAFVLDVIDNCPHELRWLKAYSSPEDIVNIVTDPNVDAETLLQSGKLDGAFQENSVLALRGFLACGLVVHCLCSRHRVDYGVDPRRGIRSRTAVPYRGTDTPSERAEYALPDILILYTVLSYYHSGISLAEMEETLKQLLLLGPEAQKAEYRIWFESAGGASALDASIDSVNKLDPSNAVQLKHLHASYRFNQAVVDFWLNTCVMPRETMQFDRRLVANAFDLCAANYTANSIGFSGTKDNYVLLPTQISQQTPDYQPILATDGKMIDLLLRKARVTVVGKATEMLLRSAILNLCLAEGAVALLDAGAAMAGWSNAEVAGELRKRLQAVKSHLKGVVFFDQQKDTWFVHSQLDVLCPLGSSPIRESECFVYFDESHCRGADMKLRPDALAVLTLGPSMSKDKIMQAAGRLRKLAQQQRLLFAVPPELEPKIRAVPPELESKDRASCGVACLPPMEASSALAELTPCDVLNWVLGNTVQALEGGLVEWGKHGSHFCATWDPRTRELDEQFDLKELYGCKVAKDTVHGLLEATMEGDSRQALAKIGALGALPEPYEDNTEGIRNAILERAREYGSDVNVLASGIDEECERELECEKELEREAERQYPRREPAQPSAWNFAAVFEAAAVPFPFFEPTSLDARAGVMKLSHAFKKYFRKILNAVTWDLARVYVTRNFIESVIDAESGAECGDLSEYMRPVDMVVVFAASGCCLLVSEWEADAILRHAWTLHSSHSHYACVVNAAHLTGKEERAERHSSSGDGGSSLLPMAVPRGVDTSKVSDATRAALQLLAGNTEYGTEARQAAVKKLLPSKDAKAAAYELLCVRGLRHMFSRSNLELICGDSPPPTAR